MRFRAYFSAIAFFSLIAAPQSAIVVAQEAQPPSLAVLRAKYLESISSIHTLQYDLTARKIDLEKIPPDKVPPGLDLTVSGRERYVRSGQKVARSFEWISKSESGRSKDWAAFDGKFYSQWRFVESSHLPWRDPPQGSISDSRPKALNLESHETLLGQSVFRDVTFETLLNSSESRVVGFDDVEGHRCVKVELAPFQLPKVGPDQQEITYSYVVWFDPAVGYLPRLFRNRVSGESELTGGCETFKFQRIETPDKQLIWFPESGVVRRHHKYNEWHYEFSNVVVNEPIPDQAFQPEFTFSTYVVDKRPGAAVRIYYAGGAEGEKLYRELSAANEAARDAARKAATATTTNAIRSGVRKVGAVLPLQGWVALISVAVLAAAGALFVLQRRTQQSQ